MKLIGKAIDQKPTGEDGSHRVGCQTAMWKERRKHNIMSSKQHNESILLIRTNIRLSDKSKYFKVGKQLYVGA